MEDFVKFKGHFKVEAFDQSNNVIDCWQDDNMIMQTARLTMAELFALLTTNASVNRVVLGTKGYNGDVRVPKTATQGFVDTRNRLFSETIDANDGGLIDLKKGDIIRYIGATNPTGTSMNYYEYQGNPIDQRAVADMDFGSSNWIDLGTTSPFTYTINFDMPRTTSGNALNIVEDDGAVGSTVEVTQSGNDVQFVISLSTLAGNGADDPTPGSTTFTEAALYANDRIFAMKTFSSKIKDTTVLLKITWTISF